jgi:hypothetical protein
VRKDDNCGDRPLRFQFMEPLPIKTVHFTIFDHGCWEAEVNFFDNPVDLISESVELAHSIVQEAIASAKPQN